MYNYKVQRLLNNLDKAYKGPVLPMKEWDTKIIPKTIKGILKKYGLNGTLDMENPINCDDDLADAFFKAGWELALELGMYCEDTERVIKVTEDELLEVTPKSLRIRKTVLDHGIRAAALAKKRAKQQQ